MTTPVVLGSSGVAANAAKRLPSAASSTRSSCETAAPEIGGIGGSESSSKHMAAGYQRSQCTIVSSGLRRAGLKSVPIV